MTRKEAKRELRPIKDMDSDIRSIEMEIERLMAVATKMTANYDPMNVSSTPNNKMEEAILKIEEYRSRLSKMLLKSLDYRNACLNKIEKIEPASLQKILVLYYFQDKTIDLHSAERKPGIRIVFHQRDEQYDRAESI